MGSSTVQNIFLRFGWLIITGFAIFLFSTTTLYFYYCYDSDYNFLNKKQDVVFNVFWRTAFYIHISGAMVALLLGPFQFVKKLRNRYLKWHRRMGKTYIIAVLFLAGPSGLFMAFYAEGGIIASIGFSIMAIVWITTTYMAYESIRKKNIEAHKAWMTRSFAMTFSAVTLRLYVPIASALFHVPSYIVEASSAWVSWVPNLLVAELLLLIIRKKL